MTASTGGTLEERRDRGRHGPREGHLPRKRARRSRVLTNVNGTLFFVVNDGVHGYELWKSNGTEGGTVLVKEIYPAAGGGAIPTSSPM